MKRRLLLALSVGLTLIPAPSHMASAREGSGDQQVTHEEYPVAVLSPDQGPLLEAGKRHRESVQKALGLKHGDRTITVQNHTLRFDFRGTRNPLEDTTTCVEQAKSAEREGAIAILGPVASDCTRQVLSENLRIPVISSLSTRKQLSEQKKWFFRTIAHDGTRAREFVEDAEEWGIEVHDKSFAIYKDSAYGNGLRRHFMDEVSGLEPGHTVEWESAFESRVHGVELTDSLRREIRDHSHAIETLFVLGSSDRRALVLQALDELFEDDEVEGDPGFVVVGSTSTAGDFPSNTWIIGEAQVRTSQKLISEIDADDLPEELYVSTFDAALVLKQAIERGLDRSNDGSLSRDELREVLQEGSFYSSERYRGIEFNSNGDVFEPPKIPIYRVSVERRLENVNLDRQESWVELRMLEEPRAHLEGPMAVELIPHGADLVNEAVALQLEGISDKPVTVETVTLREGGTRATFVPSLFENNRFPTAFSITTRKEQRVTTPGKERVTIDGLGWPASYPVAALTALIGAFLYVRHTEQRRKNHHRAEIGRSRTVQLYVERCVAGLVMAFLIIHVAPLLEAHPTFSQIPIPQFGSSLWVNAVIAGLLGGWLGINPLASLAASVIGVVTPLFRSET